MARKRIDELDLVHIADRQRTLLFIVLALILNSAISFGLARSGSTPPGGVWLYWGVQATLAVVGAIALTRLNIALGESIGVAVILGFLLVIPVLGMLILIAAGSQSNTILKLAGAKVGLFGVSSSEREKLKPGHCKGCGYPRESLESLAPCPECGRVPIVW